MKRRGAIRNFGAVMFGAALLALVPAQSGLAAGPVPTIPAEARKVTDEAKYRNSRWGLHVADLKTGEVLFDWNGDQRFLAASTTKLWAGAAALDAYGPDYRFTTPIYRTGPVEGGTLVTSIYDWSAIDDRWRGTPGTWPVIPEASLKATLGILERTVRAASA